MKKKFVIYCRVSTRKQGDSGLGLEAQLESCLNYIKTQPGADIVGQFYDVMSGANSKRPELKKAMQLCKESKATLVISKLDRLARDVEFVFNIFNSGIDIYVVDMPVVNTVTVGIFASVAQYELELISTRTRDGLQSAKRRGTLLGSQNDNWKKKNENTINKWQKSGAEAGRLRASLDERNIMAARYVVDARRRTRSSWAGIAEEMNRYGFKTPRGKNFLARTVQRLYDEREKYGIN